MSKTHGHHFNMFVMKKELLQHYCTWLFDILFELERELDMTGLLRPTTAGSSAS